MPRGKDAAPGYKVDFPELLSRVDDDRGLLTAKAGCRNCVRLAKPDASADRISMVLRGTAGQLRFNSVSFCL